MQLMDYSLLIGVRRERFTVLDSNSNSTSSSEKDSGSNRAGDRSSVMRDTELSMLGEGGSMVSRPTSSIVARPNGSTIGGLANGLANGLASGLANGNGLVSNPSSNQLLSEMSQDVFRRDLDGGMRARLVEGPGTYYIGIIDVLQEWNFKKKMERFLKINVKRYDGDGLSAIEPIQYSERFWRGAVLDTFDGLEYDTEELLSWRGDDHHDHDEPEYLPA